MRRCRLSARAIALLDAFIEIQPSIPLRFVDARGLHLGPERYMQMADGNDQLPRRLAQGLDVRLRARRAPDRLVSLVRGCRDREGAVRGRPSRSRRSRSAHDRHRLEPSATGGEGARTRLATLRDRSCGRSAVPGAQSSERRGTNGVLQRHYPALAARPLRRPARECRDRDDHPQCRVGASRARSERSAR